MLQSLIQTELKPLESGIDELHEKQYSIEEVLESTEELAKIDEKPDDIKKNQVKKKKETWQTNNVMKEKPLPDKGRKNIFVEKPNEAVKRKRRKKVGTGDASNGTSSNGIASAKVKESQGQRWKRDFRNLSKNVSISDTVKLKATFKRCWLFPNSMLPSEMISHF